VVINHDYFETALALLTLILLLFSGAAKAEDLRSNPLIDFNGFLEKAQQATEFRKKRLLSEAQFLEFTKDPNTVVLDTRSESAFRKKHVAGARHLNLSAFTKESLAQAIPNKDTRILIYCNNNFAGDAENFPSKAPTSALNISTFITLYDYGYRNIYLLKPLLDVERTKIRFVPALIDPRKSSENPL